jgi:hypothetical protein
MQVHLAHHAHTARPGPSRHLPQCPLPHRCYHLQLADISLPYMADLPSTCTLAWRTRSPLSLLVSRQVSTLASIYRSHVALILSLLSSCITPDLSSWQLQSFDAWHTFFACISPRAPPTLSQSTIPQERHDIVYRVVDLSRLLRVTKVNG